MDAGLIHRLAVLCKDYYVNRTIDDLFMYAGADRQWRMQPEHKYSSDRMNNFYSWVDGIRASDFQQLDAILEKVAADIARNEQIPSQEREAITASLHNNNQIDVTDADRELEAFFATLARMLASAGLAREVAVVTFAEPVLDQDIDSWGNEYYNLYLRTPHKLYMQIEHERKVCEANIHARIKDLVRGRSWPISTVEITPQIVTDDQWREKASAWLAGAKINNQGRVRSDNVAPRNADGLQFRSEPEIHLYRALKKLGVSFAPLPVFVRGGEAYRRIEPDFVIVKSGIVMVVEVDGDTYHHETPAEADNRTLMLENEGAHVFHVSASECKTPDLADHCAERILDFIARLKDARR